MSSLLSSFSSRSGAGSASDPLDVTTLAPGTWEPGAEALNEGPPPGTPAGSPDPSSSEQADGGLCSPGSPPRPASSDPGAGGGAAGWRVSSGAHCSVCGEFAPASDLYAMEGGGLRCWACNRDAILRGCVVATCLTAIGLAAVGVLV